MKIKLCGLTRSCDIEAVNELQPDYIGFVFAKKSRRYVSPEKAEELKPCSLQKFGCRRFCERRAGADRITS